MILYNIADKDEKDKFFEDSIEWIMPVFIYRGTDNEGLVLVVWNEITDQLVIDEFITDLGKKENKKDEINSEDEPLYEDGEEAFDNGSLFL